LHLELHLMIFLPMEFSGDLQSVDPSRFRSRFVDGGGIIWWTYKNRVYGLSNTTADNLRSTRSVSTVGSSPSVSNTQSEEFIALKQQYQQLLM
jgi:hypothetical protein